ncbi:MAG: IclR family transcriptional regulator [Dehalococcoidales bacterium]|nr:IclR family transcriptional regulator [Dehalococcoidales bacterium]
MSDSKGYWVPTVAKTVDVIETLAAAPSGLGVSALSAKTGLAKSTVSTIASTLRDLGYVTLDADTRTYQLTWKVLALANKVQAHAELRRITYRPLRQLQEATGETVNLAVMKNGVAVYIDTMEGPGPLKISTQVGSRLYLHCSALGKVLLAWLPEAEAEALAREQGFPRRTPNTIADWPTLGKELRRVAALGYATDQEEDVLGMRCLGAPLRNYEGRVVGGISLTVPTSRADPAQQPARARQVLRTANEISILLGYEPRAESENGQDASVAGPY